MWARLLVLLGLGWLLWMLWRKWSGSADPQAEAPPPPPAAPEAMRRCAECGVHLPDSQTYPGRGGVFCSPEHRQQFEARHPT